MAIAILQSVRPNPTGIKLPGSVTLVQAVQSDLPSETVLIEYRLSAEHNVWFINASGQPTNSIVFQETIPVGGIELRHRAQLAASHRLLSRSVQITEIITDADGEKLGVITGVGIS